MSILIGKYLAIAVAFIVSVFAGVIVGKSKAKTEQATQEKEQAKAQADKRIEAVKNANLEEIKHIDDDGVIKRLREEWQRD